MNSLATIFFQSLTTARDELLDPQKRAKYDTALDRKARAMKNLSLSRAPPVIRVFCRNNDFVVELVDDYDWISVLVKVEVMFCCVDNVASTDFETEILLSDFVGREMMIFKCGGSEELFIHVFSFFFSIPFFVQLLLFSISSQRILQIDGQRNR